jgi:transposase
MPPVDRNKPKRAASSDSTYSLMEFMRDFPDDAACLDWLWRHIYSPDGEHSLCPKCQRERKFHRVRSRPSYSCDFCGRHINPTAGTIFHKSSTSLRHWFHAILLMSSTRCGISAKQLERELGVTYKTAWRMFNRIRRLLLADFDDPDPLSGEIEIDEMYVGGKPRLGQVRTRLEARRWGDRKAKVLGMVERGGRVIARVVPDMEAETVMKHVRTRVLPEAVVYSDEHKTYRSVGKAGYQHKRIHHAARVYVDGDVHTQTIEGFWSLVKRGISGVYHSVSAKYLQAYLDEYAFRYNHRQDATPIFQSLLENVSSEQDALLASGSPS